MLTSACAGVVFAANMVGYVGNLLVPARGGEILRTVLVSKRSTLSKTYVFTTALGERLADVVVLSL